MKKVKNVSDGILRRHDFAWRFVLRSRSGIVEQHGATASVDRSLGSCVCYPQEREKNDKQSNAGGRCGFITRVFHSAVLSSRARRRNDWRWIFIIRDNNSSHFIDIFMGLETLGFSKWKILARYVTRNFTIN